MNGINFFNYSAGKPSSGGGGTDPAEGFIDDGDTVTVANYASLPSAAANSGKLAWVLADSGTLWTKKYAGWYVSDGATWSPATLPDDQYVVTAALQTDVDAADTLLIQAYDVDGAAYTTFGTLTANNTPTFDLSTAVTIGGNAFYYATGTDVPVTDGGTGASTSAGAATNLGLGTGDSPQFTAVNIGHATDTTLTRVSAGVVAIEGDNIIVSSKAPAVFGITIDGGGSAITTGVKGYVRVPYAMTITEWELVADQSGSIVIDVWKDTYANYPPTVADTIAGTEKPTLSTATKNNDTSLSTWTTSVSAGDYIGFKVDSATTVTRVHLSIKGTRT